MQESGTLTQPHRGQTDSEWDVFGRAQTGDHDAWRLVFTKHRSRLQAIAMFITGSSLAAEDIVQDTFTRALEAPLRNRNGTVSGYLGTITYRLAVKEARRNRRITTDIRDEPVDPHPDPLGMVLSDERDRAVAQALQSLEPQQREALVLRCYAGHSYEEIARLIGIPLGTAKSRVFYAVKAVREMLKCKGVLE